MNYVNSHVNLDAANDAIEEGVFLDDLPEGAVIEARTKRHIYRIEKCGEGKVLISGHPHYCPRPTLVELLGSTGHSATFKIWYVGKGMQIEFLLPDHGLVHTTRVLDIHKLDPSLEEGHSAIEERRRAA